MRRSLILIILLFFTLPVLAKNTILILGDSLSSSYGFDTTAGWVNLLKRRLAEHRYDYQVINASITGDTTSNGLARLGSLLTKHQPQITIIELGGNDGLRGLDIDIIRHNLEKIINEIKKTGSKILVLGIRLPPNYGVSYTQQFQQIYLNLAKRSDVEVVPLFLSGVDEQTTLMQQDGIHPSAAAQIKLLDNMWPTVEKMLK